MGQHGPRVPSPTLADFGKGRFVGGPTAALERFDGTGWRQVGRFRNVHDAGIAYDEAVGAGADPSTVRVTEIGPSLVARAFMIAGAVVFLAIAGFALYVVFG
jgi:hypothetical protein